MIDLRFLHRGFKARYRDQRHEIRAIIKAASPNDVLIDIGANKGSYLPAMSRAVPAGQVIAFEPQPILVDYLRKACARCRLTNVTIEHLGISDQSGSLTLTIPGDQPTSPGASFEQRIRDRSKNSHTIDVPITTLDKYLSNEQRRVAAIKIDVEGHELAVLRGADELIKKHAPLIICEIESRHMTNGTVLTALEAFHELNYAGHFIHRSKLKPITSFNPDIHQRTDGDRFWDKPDYCNNFILKRKR